MLPPTGVDNLNSTERTLSPVLSADGPLVVCQSQASHNFMLNVRPLEPQVVVIVVRKAEFWSCPQLFYEV
jgi:hypothetical protein